MFGKGESPPSSQLADRMRKAVERSIAPDGAFPQHTRTERPARQAVYRQGTLDLAEGKRLSVAIKDLSEGGARVE